MQSNNVPSRITMRITNNSLSLAVVNQETPDQIDYEPVVVKSGISMAANLRNAFKESVLLERPYARATVLIDTPVMLIPLEEFDEDEKTAVYRYAVTGHDADLVAHCALPDENAVAIFAVNKDLKMVIEDHIPDVRFRPLMYAVWSRFHRKSFSIGRHKLFVYFHDKRMEVFSFDKNRFQYSNVFDATSAQDSVFFILYAWKQLGYSQRDDEILVMGETKYKDSLLEMLRRYVLKVHTVSMTAEFNRAPVTQLKGITLDMVCHFVKR